jgi:hypothetical protein
MSQQRSSGREHKIPSHLAAYEVVLFLSLLFILIVLYAHIVKGKKRKLRNETEADDFSEGKLKFISCNNNFIFTSCFSYLFCIYFIFILYLFCIYFVFISYLFRIYFVFISYLFRIYFVFISYLFCIYFVFISYLFCIYFVFILYLLHIYFIVIS